MSERPSIEAGAVHYSCPCGYQTNNTFSWLAHRAVCKL